MVVDGIGNLVLAGSLFGADAVDFGCGPLTEPMGHAGAFVAMLNRCRTCVWSRIFDGTSPVGLAVSPAGDLVLAANVAGGSSAFVAGLDGNGSPLWIQGVAGLDARDVAIDGSGDVILTGTFSGTIQFGGDVLTAADGASTFVGKLGPGGPMWARGFGPNVLANGIATDASGAVLLAGIFETPIDFGCGALAGMPNQFVQPFAAKLDAGGNCLYSRWFSASDVGRAFAIAVDAASNAVVSGSFAGSIDLGAGPPVQGTGFDDTFVVALRPDGTTRWGKDLGNADGGEIAVNGAGDVFVEGLLSGPADFGGGAIGDNGDVFLASLSTMGGYRWAKSFGRASSVSLGALAADSSSSVLLAGGVGGTIDFGCGPLASTGTGDVFLAEFVQ
jgi:hypothetical protein